MADDNELLKGDRHIPTGVLIKRLLKYVKPEIPSFILASVLLIVNVAFNIIFPLLVSNTTDALLTPNDSTMKSIIFFAVGYIVLSLVGQVLMYFEAMILQKAGQKIIYELRMEAFQHILSMSQNQFNEMPVGALVTRVANYTSAMSSLFTDVIVNLTRNILTIVGVYGVMFYISPKLSLITLIFVFIVFFASFFFSKIVKKIFTNERKYTSDINTFLNENLSGMKIIQIFNQEIRKDKEFSEKNEALRKAKYKVVLAFGIYRPFITLLFYTSAAVTFLVGSALMLTSGEIVAFYLYLSRFFNPIQNIADQLNNIQKAVTSSERLFNLLDTPPQVMDAPDAIELDHINGKIEFKNVWFAYKDEEWVLKDVSFVIEPKTTCAFVGATGSGKTTILSLIVRNYEVQKGQILIDDIDIKNIKIQSLRKLVGQMLQDVFLFSGTIKNNITLHDDSFTNDEINEVCKYVNADTVINKMEKGLDEEVIERGENLSQGQRQLLSFARTVLHKPQLLILDEATANIDTETEVLIQESLEKIKNIGTMLVVAHRLSTIQKSDQIIVLQHGEIIEKGDHQSLLKMKGYYYRLFEIQFKKH